MSTEPLDLESIPAYWLNPCGSCDFGLPTSCTCAPEGSDPRPDTCRLYAEVKRIREAVSAEMHAIGYPSTGDPVKDIRLLINEMYRGREDEVRTAIVAQRQTEFEESFDGA